MNAFVEEQERRSFYAQRLEGLFKSRPLEWIGLPELMKIGGPSWRSRLACDLRIKRKLDIEWNKNNRESAYRFVPHVAIGRDSTQPTPALPLFDDGPWSHR